MVQLNGILTVGYMSVAMILELRRRWPESCPGGLDKLYRLHKWLGITAVVLQDVLAPALLPISRCWIDVAQTFLSRPR